MGARRGAEGGWAHKSRDGASGAAGGSGDGVGARRGARAEGGRANRSRLPASWSFGRSDGGAWNRSKSAFFVPIWKGFPYQQNTAPEKVWI